MFPRAAYRNAIRDYCPPSPLRRRRRSSSGSRGCSPCTGGRRWRWLGSSCDFQCYWISLMDLARRRSSKLRAHGPHSIFAWFKTVSRCLSVSRVRLIVWWQSRWRRGVPACSTVGKIIHLSSLVSSAKKRQTCPLSPIRVSVFLVIHSIVYAHDGLL